MTQHDAGLIGRHTVINIETVADCGAMGRVHQPTNLGPEMSIPVSITMGISMTVPAAYLSAAYLSAAYLSAADLPATP